VDLATAASRPPEIVWPEGVRAAACLTFDMDAEAAVLTADMSSRDRMGPMSHQAYGPLVGVPRILGILADHGVRATFFVPGFTAHRYPDIVRMVAEAGHEIAHHSYFHENTIGMDIDTEARMIDLGLRALRDVAGVVPTGYRAPMWEINWHTPALLADRGFRYDSSLMDADGPYRLHVDASAGPTSLIEVPIWWGLDDWEQYAFLPDLIGSGVIESPVKVLEMWRAEADAQHAEGGLFHLTCHPFLTGRASRAAALDQLIGHVRSLPGMWVATVDEIAQHTQSLNLTPRRVERPELPVDAPWIHHHP
jgi:peptidoglycan-N-acetylglucosamine deacetylase